MERDIVRELTLSETELSGRWQVFPEVVRTWVDELNLNAETIDTAIEWALKENHIDLIMDAKREFFEASLFKRESGPKSPEPTS